MTRVNRCPVCVQRPELRPLDLPLGAHPLWRCDVCNGVLANREAVVAAKSRYHADHYVMVVGHGRPSCRGCRAVFEGSGETCPRCGRSQALRCPECARSMDLVGVAGVTVDVCWLCRVAWFDRGELGLLTRHHDAELRRNLHSRLIVSGTTTGDVAVQVLASDPLFAAEVAHTAGEVVVEGVDTVVSTGAAGEVVSATGEAATTAGEAAFEVSKAAAEVILDVLACLFS